MAERVVIVGGSDTIKLVSYVNSATAACVTVSPKRAVAIALDLLDLAHRRWSA